MPHRTDHAFVELAALTDAHAIRAAITAAQSVDSAHRHRDITRPKLIALMAEAAVQAAATAAVPVLFPEDIG